MKLTNYQGMILCMNHWLSFNTVVEHIFTLTGATWSSRNVIGPAQFMSYWPSSKGLKHLAHMNKESRGNTLESTGDNIFVLQHKILNADVSSERGSSSQAPVLENTVSSQATQGYECTQRSVLSVLERFSLDCRKTKTKVNTLANQRA